MKLTSSAPARWRRRAPPDAAELYLREALGQIEFILEPDRLGNDVEERVDVVNADSAKHRFALLARDGMYRIQSSLRR